MLSHSMSGKRPRARARALWLVAALAFALPAHAITDITFPDPLPIGAVDEPYSFAFVPVGDHLPNFPLDWAIVPKGCLPATSGISLDSGTGVLSGTPPVAGTYSCDINAFDNFDDSQVTKRFTLIVQATPPPPPPPPPPPCVPPTITSAAPPAGTVGVLYAFAVTAIGDSPLTLTVTGLPAGLSFASASNIIEGRPVAAGSSPLRIVAHNNCAPDAVQTPVLTIVRSPSALSLAASPNPAVFSQTVTATLRATGGPTVPQGTVLLCAREASAFCAAPFGTIPPGTAPERIRTPLSATLDASGQASFALPGLRIDNYVLEARYGGDAAHDGASAGPIDEFVIKGVLLSPPAVALLAPARVNGGATVPIQVAVIAASPAPMPTGEVRLYVDVAVVGSAALDAAGTAQFGVAAPASGTLRIHAEYAGNTLFAPATSPAFTIVVAADPDPNTIPAISHFGLVLLALGIVAAAYLGRGAGPR